MNFPSDNAGPAHPAIMQALVDANIGHATSYGEDDLMAEVRARVRDLFEAPEAAVYLVATGTAANALSLATLAQPWETIFCARTAHVQEDEANAPEFFTGGAKLTLVDAPDGRMTPDALRHAIDAEGGRGVHGPKRGPVTITETSEKGSTHGAERLRALAGLAREYDLPVHLDGARLSNALVHSGATPADLTWRAGVDVASFGGTKNGCPGVEIVILFDPARAMEFEYRRKRAGHLFSKHRYLSAQVLAWLEGDLWHTLATQANKGADRLARGLRAKHIELVYPVEGNLLFFRASRALHRHLHGEGANYHLWGGELDSGEPDESLIARLVCDWSVTDEDVDRFVTLV